MQKHSNNIVDNHLAKGAKWAYCGNWKRLIDDCCLRNDITKLLKIESAIETTTFLVSLKTNMVDGVIRDVSAFNLVAVQFLPNWQQETNGKNDF